MSKVKLADFARGLYVWEVNKRGRVKVYDGWEHVGCSAAGETFDQSRARHISPRRQNCIFWPQRRSPLQYLKSQIRARSHRSRGKVNQRHIG